MNSGKKSFDYMVETILRDPSCKLIAKELNHRISKSEYEEFKHNYLFDALKEIPYGEAFCKKFGIIDYGLYYSRDRDFSIEIIEKNYLE